MLVPFRQIFIMHNVRFAEYRQRKYKDASKIASLMDSIASVTLGREKMIYFLIM